MKPLACCLFTSLALIHLAAPAWAASPAAPASAPSAASAQWGAPAARPSEPDDPDRATGDWFHDYAALMVRLRSVGWIAQICGEVFPANAELEQHAYDDWLRAHRAFVDEMEGQFAALDRRWAAAGRAAAASAPRAAALQARLDANLSGLREDFLARPRSIQQRRCDAYPNLLPSKALDLERSQAELVRSVRLGPPPTP